MECSPLYAPFDVVCVGVDGPDLGNAVFWQSQNKVRFADGTIDYATIMIIHDNNLDGIRVGVKYSQGTQIANAELQAELQEIIIILKLQRENLHINMT